ncbi:MAG: DUF58 domain-containing protein [Treponema sp.]|jgi:uncharacterized protein (DUF58 family)|nr:DUF58 domain-containing protein [Treponema sp.]
MKPGRTFFVILLCLLILGTAAFFFDSLILVWIVSGSLLLPFIIIDALVLLLFTDRLQVDREISGTLALGRKAPVQITISRTKGFLARSIRLFDIYPDTLDCTAFPAKLDRCISRSLIFEYPVIPHERGSWEFTKIELLLGSALGFWQFKVIHPCHSRGRTFPDFRKIAGNADLRGILEQTGIKIIRKRGQGMEFMNLREYQKGDSVKAIDWRATGRRRKPIVREYQEEQDQQVLLLLDSGYRLHRLEETAQSKTPGGFLRTQFDSALEAALLLSWVALKHSDGVALGCFGTEERWLPPRKGMSALMGLIQSLYDVKSAPAPSSLFSALESALARLKRRTFIIMISNFREEDGESLSWILRRIQRRHLLLLVSLKEMEAEAIARRKPADGDEALETAAAFSYLSARRRLYKTWEHLGLLTLECNSRELSSALINRYLEVKRSGLL